MSIKKIILFVVLFFGFYNLSVAQKDLSKRLIGKWEWVESSGGFAGAILTPNTEGYKIRIEFVKKNIFRSYKDGSFNLEKKYKIIFGKSIYSSENAYIIQYIHPNGQDMGMVNDSFEFKGKDTLILKQECPDGYSRVYSRKK